MKTQARILDFFYTFQIEDVPDIVFLSIVIMFMVETLA